MSDIASSPSVSQREDRSLDRIGQTFPLNSQTGQIRWEMRAFGGFQRARHQYGHRGVGCLAQLVGAVYSCVRRAAVFGTEGCRFESYRACLGWRTALRIVNALPSSTSRFAATRDFALVLTAAELWKLPVGIVR